MDSLSIHSIIEHVNKKIKVCFTCKGIVKAFFKSPALRSEHAYATGRFSATATKDIRQKKLLPA